MRLANPEIRVRDALRIVEDDAELACLRELDDGFRVAVHQLEDLSAHESRDGQAQCLAPGRMPVDDLPIQRQGLLVIAHDAHHRRQHVRGQDMRLPHR